MEEYTFTEDQQKAYDLLKTGNNCFITGSAGTGKSFVIEKYIKEMKDIKKNVIVTAPTGIAAVNIGGATFHSTFKYKAGPLVPMEEFRVKYAKVWDVVDIIVIDEVSMLRIDAFDLFCAQLKDIESRQNRHIQVILSGDFSQLPPVIGKQEEALLPYYSDIKEKKGYIFWSKFWGQLELRGIYMKKVVRQTDEEFIKHLEMIKRGLVAGVDWINNNANVSMFTSDDSIVLCSMKDEARAINEQKLANVPSKDVMYKGLLQYNTNITLSENDMPNDIEVHLKVGAIF